ncbi:asparagine synthetase domain-containing protein CG17486 [Lucilia sericata]|uniref:asparagine synthetase domain-containing protein CG17486 n=1 Tax=Lucilia sericata TaxID=13632 RepID=UPI0018A85CD3|nr:asparagine synthetase domain-containing protein CG17486 [Lucilia sericata]
MCGIFCCVSNPLDVHSCLKNSNLMQRLENRGPNATQFKECGNALFGGFVLWHQGTEICVQPLESDSHLLLFNGDIFNINNCELRNMSDSQWIFGKLSNAKDEYELISYFKTIEGPYSIIFYDKANKTIYFARDSLGRNSLLIEKNCEHFRLLSTSSNTNMENNTMELPPLGIYKINIEDLKNCYLFPWRIPDEDWHAQIERLEKSCDIEIKIRNHIECPWSSNELKDNKYNFNLYDLASSTTFSTTSELYDFYLKNNDVFNAIHQFSVLIEESVKKRVQYTTPCCASCLGKINSCTHSKVAILFSGGIDCSILAVLCDKFIPKTDSIDLVNVAFESTRTDSNWDVPDRISGKSSFKNLIDICPDRKWNFIEVNVSKKEIHQCLSDHIKHLIYPLNTVLDESIGCAFWFASRAIGLKGDSNWKSSARVVILGSGADELFGGYVRHKNAYIRHNGTEEEKQLNLLSELEKDWNRIPSRNLARDDRVISDNGKTPRAPFIEEHVVNFVRSLSPNQRCCFLLEDGIGDKLFLRLYGYYIGLKSSAFLKKRAIQFGSRIANKKQNAADRSSYM